MKGIRRASLAVAGLLATAAFMTPEAARAQAFDFDTGNSPVEIIIPAVIPVVLEDVSVGANDATLVLRITSELTVAWFDAIAPYHPTAVGVYSRLGRRPAAEGATNRNKNIAILHASYHVLESLLPERSAEWRALLTSVGLDPDDGSLDLATPVGIGNAAGKAVVEFRERDGMNQLGDEGGRIYNRQPYMGYTIGDRLGRNCA